MKAPILSQRCYPNLRQLMAIFGYTHANLARQIRRSKVYVDRIMAGEGSFRIEEGLIIMAAFGVDDSWFHIVFDKNQSSPNLAYELMIKPMKERAVI